MGQSKLTITTRIQDDLDLHDEQFLTPDEIGNKINDAIRDAGALIQAIKEDYFLEITHIPVVNGTSEYQLPATMFANKIRRIWYENEANTFKISRVTDLNELPELSKSSFNATNFFKYIILNNSQTGMRLKLFPTPTEDTTLGLVIARTNLLKATINSHYSDITQHTTAIDDVNTITLEDAYDEYTLYALLEEMLLSYYNHELDAAKVSLWAYHAGKENPLNTLTSIVKPINISDALLRLNDLQLIYNLHDADATAHAIPSLHQQIGDPVVATIDPFKMYFIRRPKELVEDTDETDIPEFENYILAKAKEYCLEKDIGNPMLQKVMATRLEQEKLLQESLSNKIEDDQSELRLDYEHYGSYDDNYGGY